MKRLFAASCLLFFYATGITQTTKKQYPEIDIAYKKFVLDNGLTLIVHEDHKAPIAAFNIWYHVGSKNEPVGKNGFAHLFEHLMFTGSENNRDKYFTLLDAIGGTDVNGTTNNDRTNYFEDVPTSGLDKILWAESDRMGYLLGSVDSSRLEEQRGVVENEKRQGENQPYAIGQELTAKSTFPAGHPYSWTVIGEKKDLDSASLDDVKEWFKSYYGPNNVTVVIAGDINTDSVYQKVKKYFGAIPASPPIARQSEWVAKMSGIHYQTAQDRVPQARLQKTWNVPQWGTADATYLNLLSDILTNGKTSRLYKRLVYDDQLSSNIYSYVDEREIASQFNIFCYVKPGFTAGKIDTAINQELQKILTQGPTVAEVARAKTNYFAGFVKGMERIGGFGGTSDILAQSETFGGTPGYYKKIQAWIKNATPADIKKAAVAWLSNGQYVLDIEPYGTYTVGDSVADRKQQPPLGAPSVVKFPTVKQFTLSNGLKVALVERNSVPVIDMSLMVNAGYAADQFGKPGLSKLTMTMMQEGTKTKSALQLSDDLANAGASLYTYSDLDNSYLYMSALKPNLDQSLNLFTDVLYHPSFPEKNFERVQKEQLLDIKQEQSQPFGMGLRILPRLLYGASHAYSNSFTGSGTEASVKAITRDDLVKFHDSWFAPNNAILVVVGDIKADELKTKLESSFASWKKQPVPEKNLQEVAIAAQPSVYIIDKPGALQSIIFSAEISPSAKDPDYEKIQMMNRILGGEFTSRLNMNLREDKHWSYGAGSVNIDTKGPGFFAAYAPVQTDKTKESMQEMQKELTQYIGDKPATEVEFDKVQKNAVMQLPGVWETNGSVLNALQTAIEYDRGINYLNDYPAMLQHLTLTDIRNAAMKVDKPNNLTWVIVGDRSKIEKGVKELNLGPIKYIDTEGNEVK
ncbi:MAG: insulinase family protein [Bacteroidota bacterium]|nr:insulinase family protein [Bacteroidota bacterium]